MARYKMGCVDQDAVNTEEDLGVAAQDRLTPDKKISFFSIQYLVIH